MLHAPFVPVEAPRTGHPGAPGRPGAATPSARAGSGPIAGAAVPSSSSGGGEPGRAPAQPARSRGQAGRGAVRLATAGNAVTIPRWICWSPAPWCSRSSSRCSRSRAGAPRPRSSPLARTTATASVRAARNARPAPRDTGHLRAAPDHLAARRARAALVERRCARRSLSQLRRPRAPRARGDRPRPSRAPRARVERPPRPAAPRALRARGIVRAKSRRAARTWGSSARGLRARTPRPRRPPRAAQAPPGRPDDGSGRTERLGHFTQRWGNTPSTDRERVAILIGAHHVS